MSYRERAGERVTIGIIMRGTTRGGREGGMAARTSTEYGILCKSEDEKEELLQDMID